MKRDPLYIVRRLRRGGHEAYLVGGSVRDLLMGCEPKDYDIATSARPEEVMELFEKTIPVGARFGVVIVRYRRKSYEVATFREDLGYSDGRRPEEVRFAGAREDALRRDFTINGLFYDPETGEVIDHVGGREDIEAGLIRAIGDPAARFGEDKLRMLRAVRFAARFGHDIEENTAAAIGEHASEISVVSAERVRDELVKILAGPDPAGGMRLMDGLGLLEHVLPEVHAMKGVEQPPQFHPEGDVFEHTMIMLDNMRPRYARRPGFAMAVLLHDVGKPPTMKLEHRITFNNHAAKGTEMAREILGRLRFPAETVHVVQDLVGAHMHFINVADMRPAKLKRFLRRENFDLHLELHRLDCLASHGGLDNHVFCRQKLRELGREKRSLAPERLLTGTDLIELGYKPGPLFKEMLEALEDAQLEGEVEDREGAVEWVRARYPLTRGE